MKNSAKIMHENATIQKWNTYKQLQLSLDFIDLKNLNDKFDDYLQQQIQIENSMNRGKND